MTSCPDCTATREAPNWPRHCPTCLWCGARYISRIRGLKGVRPVKELSTRATTALQVWVDHGHDEQTLRKLCADGCLIQPLNSSDPAPETPKPNKKRK